MCGAFLRSDYYGSSAPPLGPGSATDPPTTGLAVRREGDRGTVPTFTASPFVQGGAQLYPGSLATVTPQAFTVASCPATTTRLGVDRPRPQEKGGHALQDRPLSTRFEPARSLTGLPPLVHLRCTF